MGVRDDLLAAGIHPNALTHVSDQAVYVTAGRKEYRIVPDGPNWRIKPWVRGPLKKSLKGVFTSFKLAETTLINHLRTTDRWNRAIWPDKDRNG